MLFKLRLWITNFADNIPKGIWNKRVSMLKIEQVQPVLFLDPEAHWCNFLDLVTFLVDIGQSSLVIIEILVGITSSSSPGTHELCRWSTSLTLLILQFIFEFLGFVLSHFHISFLNLLFNSLKNDAAWQLRVWCVVICWWDGLSYIKDLVVALFILWIHSILIIIRKVVIILLDLCDEAIFFFFCNHLLFFLSYIFKNQL